MANRVPESRPSPVPYLLAGLLIVFILPLFLIGIGLFEELVLGTRVSHGLAKALGSFDLLEDLFDGIRGLLGF